ncbi:MAG: hypothetical protein VKJ64_19215 [Leptolyngbyaceae bacterium]|nr:hypothetical protein [Leptolyngbyaceae bacterium]
MATSMMAIDIYFNYERDRATSLRERSPSPALQVVGKSDTCSAQASQRLLPHQNPKSPIQNGAIAPTYIWVSIRLRRYGR